MMVFEADLFKLFIIAFLQVSFLGVDGFVGRKINPFLGCVSKSFGISEGKMDKIVLAAASSREEDLELTRQIILEHIARQELEEGVYLEDTEETEESEEPIMVRAALGEETERTPVWLFRQAGRHLPEYGEYKAKVGRNFWEMLQYAEDVAECTLQPLRRYKLDAAILFSDILVIPAAMGMHVIMPGGVGIQIPNPIKSISELENYRVPNIKEEANYLVRNELEHVLSSIDLIKKKMEEEGFQSKPLIGFSATPFTLLFYMVGGSSKKNAMAGMDFLRNYPVEAKKLLSSLSLIVIEYVVAQVEHGANLIQLFEAMGMMIDEDLFLEFELSCLEQIAKQVRERVGDRVPLMIFARGASYANKHLAKIKEYNVITIDGSADLKTIRQELPSHVVLQGNYDPKELILNDINNKETVRLSTISYLDEIGPQKLIANLGEGLSGKESPELVQEFVNSIIEESSSIMGKPRTNEEIQEEQVMSEPIIEEKGIAENTMELEKMTVAQLKEQLRSRGLKVSGKKIELIERLRG